MSHPILERLADPDPETRARACRDAALDPAAVLLIDALGEALGDVERAVARAASDALARLAREHDVAAALRRALHGRDRRGRWQAARTLARLEPPGPRLLPAAVEALDGPDAWEAARLLVDAGRLHGEVLPLLLGLVRGGASDSLRRMAAHCLRELAPDLPECADALIAASRDASPSVRRAALTALAGLRAPPPGVRERLRETRAREPDPSLRALADRALALMGEAPR